MLLDINESEVSTASHQRCNKLMLKETVLFEDLLCSDLFIIDNYLKKQETNTFDKFHE